MAIVHADPEVIRDMKSQINNTIKNLKDAVQKIHHLRSSSSEWNDEKGEQFRNLMEAIGKYIEYPIPTLHTVQPKLEKLAQSLDEYSRVKFR